MKKPAKTLEDLARISGVSIATISRALSDSPAVNAATKRMIIRLAIEHNYKFQKYAPPRALNSDAVITVVLTPPLVRQNRLSDPFLMELVAAIGEAARERRCDMVVSHATPTRRSELLELMHFGHSDGVIFIGQNSLHDAYNDLSATHPRFVVWGADLPDQRYCSVGSDNFFGAQRATRHLLRLGRRHIAFLGAPLNPEIAQRRAGYASALEEAGLDCTTPLAIDCYFDLESAENAINELLTGRTRIDAIVAASDILAFGAIRSIMRRGLSVPDDIAVIGYDNVAFGQYVRPALSTVSQNIDKAAKILVSKLLSSDRSGTPLSERLPGDLIIRESCGG